MCGDCYLLCGVSALRRPNQTILARCERIFLVFYIVYIILFSFPQLPSSIDTLKKHILLLFDRLEKGGKLSVTPASSAPAGAGAGGGSSVHAHNSAAPSKGSSRSSRQEK